MNFKNHNITFRVQNEVGVLARITLILRKYHINIQEMEVRHIPDEKNFSDMPMVLQVPEGRLNLVLEKIQRLIPVISITVH